MKVGFVGLGNIGKPMALRLASDFDLRVYDVVPEPVAELVAAGATAAGSVSEVADVDVLCVMVRDDEQVRSVAAEVLASGANPVLVVHSTVAPSTPDELAGARHPSARRAGQRWPHGGRRRHAGHHGGRP